MKHIYFIASLLRSEFAMSGLRVDAVTPDSQPTVNRRSRLTSQQRHYSVTSARVAQEWLKYAAMAVMLFTLGVGNVWGGYSSNFSDKNLSVGTGELTWSASPTFNSYESSGDARGAQSSKATSNITITSANISGTVTGVSVVASMNIAGTMGIKIGGTDFGSSATIAKGDKNKTFSFSGSATVTNKAVVITVTRGNGTFWIKSVTITTSSGVITYTLKVSNGLGGYTTYENKVKSDLTQDKAEGGNSCAGGLKGYYSGWRTSALETPAGSPGTTYNHATAGAMPASGSTLYAVYYSSGEGGYLTNTLCDACDNGTITYAKGTVPAGGGSITGSHANDTKVCETNLTLPGETFYTTGYTQDGWATSDGGDKAYNLSATTYSTEGNATLYPHWTANKYTVTWSVNGSTYTTTSNVTFNTTTSTPANPSVPGECTGSTFMGWTDDDDYEGDSAPGVLFNDESPTITGNITFYAVFADED